MSSARIRTTAIRCVIGMLMIVAMLLGVNIVPQAANASTNFADISRVVFNDTNPKMMRGSDTSLFVEINHHYTLLLAKTNSGGQGAPTKIFVPKGVCGLVSFNYGKPQKLDWLTKPVLNVPKGITHIEEMRCANGKTREMV